MYLAMVSITEHKIYLVEAVSICSMKLQKKTTTRQILFISLFVDETKEENTLWYCCANIWSRLN
jgi:hypothetical protein